MDFSVFRLRFAEHRHEFGFLFGSAFAEKMFNYWTHSYLGLHTNIAFTPSHVNLDFKQFFIRFVFMDDYDIEYYDEFDDDDEDDDMSYSGKEKTFRKEVLVKKYRDSELITVCGGIPIFDGGGYEYDTKYEYKDRLSPSDNVYEWERKDGCWYEFVDGFWSHEDYGNPDKPPRMYSEALKYRSCTSSLYSLDNDPNYTEEQKAAIRAKEAARKAEREQEENREFVILMLMFLGLVLLGFGCAWLKAKGYLW